MKLNKLYCNKPKVFPDIEFNEGLNVVLGEIRHPDNYKKTTHNIGKSTFIKIIDFCLLKGISANSFWRKNENIFNEYTFCLEFTYSKGFITIQRNFENDSRVNLLRHEEGDLNLFNTDFDWDHSNITINNAKEVLDGILDFNLIKPWDYRKITSYLLRVQDDYSDIFRLSKHRGKDIDWKPPLAQLLGLNGSKVHRAYLIDEEKNVIQSKISRLESNVKEFVDDPDKLNGLIQIKEEKIEEIQKDIDGFDFKNIEDEINKDLVDKIEKRISELNSDKYYLELEIRDIEQSISKKSNFDLDKTKKLFQESGVYFGDQIQKTYEELLEFNKKISEERLQYLKKEKQVRALELEEIDHELNNLNNDRKEALSKIREQEVFQKYKALSKGLNQLKLDLLRLKSIEDELIELEKKKEELRSKEKEREVLTQSLKGDLRKPSERYKNIRSTYNQFIKKVIDRTAIIKTKVNSSGNYTFSAPFIDKDGVSTNEDDGHTFKKLQCIAFDSAIVMNSLDMNFPHFVIHDGVLETLENRMRLNLIKLFEEQAKSGLQEIITVLDSHLPEKSSGDKYNFEEENIIRVLHDVGESGRLFKMPSW